MKKYKLEDLVNKGSHARQKINSDVIIGDISNGYDQGDILDANATVQAVNSKVDDVLGVNAEGINDLLEILHDDDATTGILTQLKQKTNDEDLATVAKSGSYNDLADTPENVSVFTNDAGYLTEHQDISGKEDVMTYLTFSGTSLSAQVGKYYRGLDVNTLTVTLPSNLDITLKSVILYITTGNSPAVTFTSVGHSPQYQDGYSIEANKSYEINCLWNGNNWIITSIQITPSSIEPGEPLVWINLSMLKGLAISLGDSVNYIPQHNDIPIYGIGTVLRNAYSSYNCRGGMSKTPNQLVTTSNVLLPSSIWFSGDSGYNIGYHSNNLEYDSGWMSYSAAGWSTESISVYNTGTVSAYVYYNHIASKISPYDHDRMRLLYFYIYLINFPINNYFALIKESDLNNITQS